LRHHAAPNGAGITSVSTVDEDDAILSLGCPDFKRDSSVLVTPSSPMPGDQPVAGVFSQKNSKAAVER
jgi:hypothetical protein